MTGFGVSASRGYPDVQLISYGEMVDSAQTVVAALRGGMPCIADGDVRRFPGRHQLLCAQTGYGNAVNVKRTVRGYAQVGMSGIMIEDQVSPKRCGHTRVKELVDFDDAVTRIRAACDARDEILDLTGSAPVIVARTDANAVHGFNEALRRCRAFRDVGADVTFLEAPLSVEEMAKYCNAVDGAKLANMLEGGKTPVLPPADLEEIGYSLVAYPLSLLSTMTAAAVSALEDLRLGRSVSNLTPFPELCDKVGFTDYWNEDTRYSSQNE